ncbi:MAG: hypothetical protein JWM11_621 [Planctomycetaceae bacterium]|nr:hypothetical protein [Planctomycetaceae bacterium]
MMYCELDLIDMLGIALREVNWKLNESDRTLLIWIRQSNGVPLFSRGSNSPDGDRFPFTRSCAETFRHENCAESSMSVMLCKQSRDY